MLQLQSGYKQNKGLIYFAVNAVKFTQ